jgi:hypothetical protein
MKKFFILLTFFLIWKTSFATGNIIEYEISQTSPGFDIAQEIEKYLSPQINLHNDYNIDITPVKEKLENIYNEKYFEFEWSLAWASTQNWPIFQRTFSEKWEKELELNIYEISRTPDDEEIKKILFTNTYSILVYEKSFLLLYSDEIGKSDISNYIEFSKKDGVYIKHIWPLSKTDIEISSIINSIKDYKQTPGIRSDFIIVWGSRDFVFNILSNINKDLSTNQSNETLNIIWLSPYNLDVLWSYLKNFLANKDWIEKIILLNESSKYLILKENKISNLFSEIINNQHDFIDVNLSQSDVKNIFFLSKFINNLSNIWYSTNSIYIFLIIPIILTIVIFFKHFIWLSPIWIIIPLFVSILFLKFWLFFGLWLIVFFVIVNLLLSLITDRYNLLYAPRMVFLITINIIVFIGMMNILYGLKIISLNISDILYFIIFILLSEKMINIMISKDLLEYKESFLYTLLIWVFCYVIFNTNSLKVVLLSYPELILFLIPMNFLIGKFSGLRVTEYFRFKEIIKSVEE